MTAAFALVNLLRSARVDLSSEKGAQVDLAASLSGAAISFEREHRFSPADIIDFFVPAIGVGIEVKLRGAQKRDVWRQLERYAKHATVAALILVSNKAMGLPEQIGGKPLYFVSLGRAWL